MFLRSREPRGERARELEHDGGDRRVDEPDAFENDPKGDKQAWREALARKLKDLVKQKASLPPTKRAHPCYGAAAHWADAVDVAAPPAPLDAALLPFCPDAEDDAADDDDGQPPAPRTTATDARPPPPPPRAPRADAAPRRPRAASLPKLGFLAAIEAKRADAENETPIAATPVKKLVRRNTVATTDSPRTALAQILNTRAALPSRLE